MRAFNVFDAAMEYDPKDPEGYKAGAHRFGPKVGASRIGATVYELPPGQAVCPYHYETEEEWVMVLQGEITLRHPEGEDVLRAGDVAAFPANAAGAHKTTNTGGETARILMWANHDAIGSVVYPDSDKVAFWNETGDDVETIRVKRGTNVDYYEGEI